MNRFTESGIQFTFGSPWRVIKYDEHRFFQGFSGVGYKGVDFLVLRPGAELVLLEVKNLTQYPTQPDWQEWLDELTGSVGQKVEDTLQGIDAIHRYYRRQWWYPCLRPLSGWKAIPAKWEWTFWEQAAEFVREPENLSIIFWLKTHSPPLDWQEQLEQQLREDLQRITNNILITSKQTLPGKKEWQIKETGGAVE